MSQIFGEVTQLGYVVRDIRAALDQWVKCGVGPWYYVDQVDVSSFSYRGKDSPLEMSVALANSGNLQIELIQQLNDAPSMYQDFLDAGNEGLQHVAFWTTRFQELYDKGIAAGFEIGHEGCIGGPDGRFAYFDTEHHPGTVMEISDISGAKGKFFEHIRDAAKDWDGAKPVREVKAK